MNCEFCGREMHLSHHENNKETAVYDCKTCPVLTSFYIREEDGVICKIAFLIDKGARAYMWTNNYLKKESYITDLLASTTSKDPLIFKFPRILDLSPQNVRQKLSMYMTFL